MKNNILNYGLILMAICSITVAALAFINLKTKPVIEQQKIRETQNAVMAVMPRGTAQIEPVLNEQGQTLYYIGRAVDSTCVGYAIECRGKGYAPDSIQTLLGVDTNMIVTGARVIAQKETPGLGDKISAIGTYQGEKKIWITQFNTLTYSQILLKKDNPQDGTIDALTGATITSRGVTLSVVTGLKRLEQYLHKELTP